MIRVPESAKVLHACTRQLLVCLAAALSTGVGCAGASQMASTEGPSPPVLVYVPAVPSTSGSASEAVSSSPAPLNWQQFDPLPSAPASQEGPSPTRYEPPVDAALEESAGEAVPEDEEAESLAEDSALTPQVYLVQPGDTLSQIAECFGVGLSVLREANEFSNARQARAGEVLRIPDAAKVCHAPEKAPPANCAPVTEDERKRLQPKCVHKVRYGESLGLLAVRNGVTVDSLLGMNRCASDQIRTGQVIKVCADARGADRGRKARRNPVSRLALDRGADAPRVIAAPAAEPPLSAPKEQACASRVRPAHGGRRVVMFSGGPVDRLFALYVDEVKKRQLEVDWASLVVTFVDDNGGQVTMTGEKLGFGETMLGLSDVRKWKKRLKGLKALARGNAGADADVLGSDLVCGPSAP